MNEKIVICVAVSFGIVFGSLYALNFAVSEPDKKSSEIFSSNILSQEKTILLLGSSYVGVLNMTSIIEQVGSSHPDYELYNLAYSNDNPSKRKEILEQMISLNPEIIFYGISYRTFSYPIPGQEFTPQTSQLEHEIAKIKEKVSHSINPKLTTLKTIEIMTSYFGVSKESAIMENVINHPNTPFYPIQNYYTQTATEYDLNRDGSQFLAEQTNIEMKDNFEVEEFRQIIKTVKENGIKIVLFTLPHHQIYFDSLPEETKQAFEKIMKEISEEFDLKIYDFRENYSEMQVWYDIEHVAHNSNGIVFSEDVGKMIISEIGK